MSMFATKPNPHSAPGDCVLIPGRRHDERGFIDTTTELEGVRGPLRLYISIEGIRQAARRHPQIGLVDADDLKLEQEANTRAAAHLVEAYTRIEKLEADFEAIAGMRRAGFTVQKIKGPRAKRDETPT